jgi:hypothetical protein
MTNTRKKAERASSFADLFRGPWSTAETAEVAGVEPPTIRNWCSPKRRVLDGRSYFWTRDAEPERAQQLRKAAVGLRTTLEKAGGDPMWITDQVAKLLREPGEVATVELVQAFVLAELARCGIAPDRGRALVASGKANLVEELTRNLFERAYGELQGAGRRDPHGASPGHLLVVDVHPEETTPDVLYIDRKDLLDHLGDEKNPTATRIVIDPAKLFRRLVVRVENVKAQRPTEQAPKP